MALNPAITLLGGGAVPARASHAQQDPRHCACACRRRRRARPRQSPAPCQRQASASARSCMFGCPLSWAANTLIARRMLPTMSPIASTTWSAIIGHRRCSPPSPRSSGPIVPEGASWRAWAALVFLAHLRHGDRARAVLRRRAPRSAPRARRCSSISFPSLRSRSACCCWASRSKSRCWPAARSWSAASSCSTVAGPRARAREPCCLAKSTSSSATRCARSRRKSSRRTPRAGTASRTSRARSCARWASSARSAWSCPSDGAARRWTTCRSR